MSPSLSDNSSLDQFSAFLESHEIIPENLLPFSASSAGRTKQPPLARLHAEHRSAYVISTSRMAFALDIPSDATPAFSIAAGTGGFSGGWEWRVRLAFLVASPPHGHRRRHNRASLDKFRAQAREKHHSVHLLPVAASLGDSDNHFFSASSGLSPMLPVTGGEGGGWQEMRSETVECEVPVKVLAGNTAFVVRPSVYAV